MCESNTNVENTLKARKIIILSLLPTKDAQTTVA